jgi:lipopolysaccharide export system protein LptA
MRFGFLFTTFILICASFLPAQRLCAQPRRDTGNTVAINILNTRTFTFSKTDSAGGLNKLIGDVVLQQGGTQMFCDSAYLDVQKNNVEAFGNVRIVQPGGTEVESDYLRYTGNTKMAYLRGAVALTDGATNLWSEVLTYDMGRKFGTYEDNGTLQSGETVLSSRRGNYNVKTKDARFVGNVIVNNPRYDVVSDDLGYNTEKKFVRFYGPSVVTNDQSELRTTGGTYDERREVAHFTTRSSIWSDDQYIEADTMDYNRGTGFGLARGEVYALDTAQGVTLWGRYAAYNEKLNTLMATIKPVLRRVSGTDTVYMAADTFFSAPDIFREKGKGKIEKTDSMTVARTDSEKRDTSAVRRTSVKKAKTPVQKAPTAAIAQSDTLSRRPPTMLAPMAPGIAPDDSTSADTAKARYFIGYHGVRVFSDSLQAICDSIRYTQRDSSLRLMRDPVAWSRAGQISGDTIVIISDSSEIKSLWVPNNALVVSRSGPEKANLFDQVQGRMLLGNFIGGELHEMIVWPSAESIYFATDDKGAYIGVDESQGERMRILFANDEISRIIIEQDPKHTMHPMRTPGITGLRLSRFVWREEERPKSVGELFQ